MSDVSLSEADQDTLLLAIYELAPSFIRGTVPKQDAPDVLHDISLEWLVKLRSNNWRTTPENLQAFVRKLVSDHLVDRRRKRIRRKDHDGEHLRARSVTMPVWVCPDRSDDEDANAKLRQQLLGKLSEQCRQTHRLIREEGLTYSQAAALLGVSVHTAHTYMARAHRILRAELVRLGISVANSHAGGRPRTLTRRWKRAANTHQRSAVHHQPDADPHRRHGHVHGVPASLHP